MNKKNDFFPFVFKGFQSLGLISYLPFQINSFFPLTRKETVYLQKERQKNNYNGLLIKSLILVILLFPGRICSQTISNVHNKSVEGNSQSLYGPYISKLFNLLEDDNVRIAGFGSISSIANTHYTDDASRNPALISRRVNTESLSFSYSAKNKNLFPKESYRIKIQKSIDKSKVFALSLEHFRNYLRSWHYGPEIEDYFHFRPKAYFSKVFYAHHFPNGISYGLSAFYYYEKWLFGKDIIKSTCYGMDFGINWDRVFLETDRSITSYSLGGSLNNLGPKSSFEIIYNDPYLGHGNSSNREFLPAQLSLGGLLSEEFYLTDNIKLGIDLAYELEKYLVPSNPIYLGEFKGKDPNVSVIRSYYQSFYDSPEGLNGELKEYIHQFGSEFTFYSRQLLFAFRLGAYRQDKEKGNMKYNTCGLSLNYFGFYINYSKISHITNTPFNSSGVRQEFFQVGYKQTIKN